MSKTTSLIKHMTDETHFNGNEHYSSTTVVAMVQNFQTYPTSQCKLLLILKMGVLYPYSSVPSGFNVLNNAKPFSGMVY